MKGPTSESVSSSFSSVPQTCQILDLSSAWLSQVLKATYGYVEKKKVSISCLEGKLCFQKDTYGQSYTIAWRAKHFPALSCFFFRSLGLPINKIKTHSTISGIKKKIPTTKSHIPIIHIIAPKGQITSILYLDCRQHSSLPSSYLSEPYTSKFSWV